MTDHRVRDFLSVLVAGALWLFMASQTVPALVLGPQRDRATSPPKAFSAADKAELRKIGIRIGRGEDVSSVEEVWKTFVAGHKGMDVDRTVKLVLEEAKAEADRSANTARQKTRDLEKIRKAIGEELAVVRPLAAGSPGPLSKPVPGKTFAVGGTSATGIEIRPGKTIATRSELDAYIRELEVKLGTVGEDAQLASIDLQNALQKQQQLVQMLSNISKMLSDTALSVIRKIG